jgi:hypothetical protein
MKTPSLAEFKYTGRSHCRHAPYLSKMMIGAFLAAGMLAALGCGTMQSRQGFPGQPITIIPGFLAIQVEQGQSSYNPIPRMFNYSVGSRTIGSKGQPTVSTTYSTTGQPRFLGFGDE